MRLAELQKAPRSPIDVSSYEWIDDGARRVHVLEVARERGVIRSLVWIPAATPVPRHTHEVGEDTLVLQGGLRLEGDVFGTFEAGNVFWTPAGASHGGETLPGDDCVCYVVLWAPR